MFRALRRSFRRAMLRVLWGLFRPPLWRVLGASSGLPCAGNVRWRMFWRMLGRMLGRVLGTVTGRVLMHMLRPVVLFLAGFVVRVILRVLVHAFHVSSFLVMSVENSVPGCYIPPLSWFRFGVEPVH